MTLLCCYHLVVVFDAHADAVEHNGDEDGTLDVSAFDEALDAAAQPGHSSSCTISSQYIPHHSSHGQRHCHKPSK